MANLTSSFNALLKGHEAPPTKPFTTDTADEFLQEAYRISSLITRLHSELRSLRQSYLSTAGPRKTHLRTTSRNGHNNSHQQTVYLTDRDREEIDANAKLTLRDLHARIRALEDAEKLRQSTQSAVIQKKYARGLGALGSWAAGGGRGGKGKTQEHAAAEAAALQLGAHREGVIWYLGQRLQETAKTQQAMMETRLTREMEKNRSVLAKARGPIMAKMASDLNSAGSSSSQWGGGATGLAMEEEERRRQQPPSDDLTEEQKQMFEKGNQDMLKHYQSTLDKVRYVGLRCACSMSRS